MLTEAQKRYDEVEQLVEEIKEKLSEYNGDNPPDCTSHITLLNRQLYQGEQLLVKLGTQIEEEQKLAYGQ